MYLLTEWEGRVGKYLARGQDVKTERSEVRGSWPREKYFPVWPDLTQSISILSYDHFFFRKHYVATKLFRIVFAGPYAFSDPITRRVRPSYGNFFLMVFQWNCARGRTGHMIKIISIDWLTDWLRLNDTKSVLPAAVKRIDYFSFFFCGGT